MSEIGVRVGRATKGSKSAVCKLPGELDKRCAEAKEMCSTSYPCIITKPPSPGQVFFFGKRDEIKLCTRIYHRIETVWPEWADCPNLIQDVSLRHICHIDGWKSGYFGQQRGIAVDPLIHGPDRGNCLVSVYRNILFSIVAATARRRL